jgi:methylmalonyl-CoA mutase
MTNDVATTPELQVPQLHVPEHPVRFVTAASLFDGHDASINIMRRILQGSGAEVIHLGHNRSVDEVVSAALQEDVQGVAVSSYQGGHVEFFKYMLDLLKQRGGAHIKVFGGGGGVISKDEIADLHAYGVERIYAPEDGQHMGLQGMINDMIERADFDPATQGGAELAFEMPAISRDMIVIIQGLVILFAGALEHMFRPYVQALFASFSPRSVGIEAVKGKGA